MVSKEEHRNRGASESKAGTVTIDMGSDPGAWAEHQAFLEMKKKLEQKLLNEGDDND